VKILTGLATLALGLSLSACGEKAADNATQSSAPVATVAAPAGTSWSQTVNETPDGHFVMGNPNAAVKLVEFGSYTCSHCRDFASQSHEELAKLVDTGKLSFELRPFVRDPIDISTALLARCGGKDVFYALSGQFFENQDAMFQKAQGLGDQRYQQLMSAPPAQRFTELAGALGLIDFAKQRGIAEDQARTCLADIGTAEKLAKSVADATSQYKIDGTPSFLLNGTMIENASTWDAVRAKLTAAGV